jgi:hypothetical protein
VKIERLKKARVYRGAGILHATKTDGPVLKGEASWRTVSGFFINTQRAGMVTVQFWHHL